MKVIEGGFDKKGDSGGDILSDLQKGMAHLQEQYKIDTSKGTMLSLCIFGDELVFFASPDLGSSQAVYMLEQVKLTILSMGVQA